jgi:hypothetical protein
MASLPAGRSLSLSESREESPPPNFISDASAKLVGPSRVIAMLGESSSIRPASSLPLLSNCQMSAATRAPAARASTRRSSFDRNSRRSKCNSGPYQRNEGDTPANPM